MRNWIAGLKRWWLRRFRGVVAPPRGQSGTTWQQHNANEIGFTCRCGQVQAFTAENYVIREQDHIEGCDGWNSFQPGSSKCNCPVTDARYIRICTGCGMGHWSQALRITRLK